MNSKNYKLSSINKILIKNGIGMDLKKNITKNILKNCKIKLFN